MVDSSFWSRASRDEYRLFLAAFGIEPVVHYVETPREVMLGRLTRRGNNGPDDISVSERVPRAFIDHFEIPSEDEGPLVRIAGE